VKRVVIRADGSEYIGMGHVMRCLTLAGELEKAGVGVLFLSRNHSAGVARIISDAGVALISLPPALSPAEDLDAAVRAARSFKAGAVICDGYFFDEAYFRGIRAAGLKLAVIDDRADRPMPADLVINENVDATVAMYSGLVGPEVKLLLGSKYSLVRKEFLDRRDIAQAACEGAGRVAEELKRL